MKIRIYTTLHELGDGDIWIELHKSWEDAKAYNDKKEDEGFDVFDVTYEDFDIEGCEIVK